MVYYIKTHHAKIEKRKNCLNAIKQDKESFGRYDYDSLISMLKEKENYREIILCYLKELLIDVSGALNYATWKRAGLARNIIRECNSIVFTPYLLRTFPKYRQYYEPEMIDEVYTLNLPIFACDKENFKDIAEMMFDGTMNEDICKMHPSKISKNLVQMKLGDK